MSEFKMLGTEIRFNDVYDIYNDEGVYTINEFIEAYNKELKQFIDNNPIKDGERIDAAFNVLGNDVKGVLTMIEDVVYIEVDGKDPWDTPCVERYKVGSSFIESQFYELFYEEKQRYFDYDYDDDMYWKMVEERDIVFITKGTGQDIDEDVFDALQKRGFAIDVDTTYDELLDMLPKDITIKSVKYKYANDGTRIFKSYDKQHDIMYALKEGDTLINQLANALKELTDAI